MSLPGSEEEALTALTISPLNEIPRFLSAGNIVEKEQNQESERDEAIASTDTVETGPSLVDPTKWFGRDVRKCLEAMKHPVGTLPDFSDSRLLTVMEPHLEKARRNREKAMQSSTFKVSYPRKFRSERRLEYNVQEYPFARILAETLGVDSDLSRLHLNSKDKRTLLRPMTNASSSRAFHVCFDRFVLKVCVPALVSLAMESGVMPTSRDGGVARVRYQAFPCLRVVRPGDFSIGPHCDAAYGHSTANLNVYVALTEIGGTSSLVVESCPGREDWHGLPLKRPGECVLFDGANCLHYTLENTTDLTRVSMDFRLALVLEEGFDSSSSTNAADDSAVDMLEDRFSRAGPGYYEDAVVKLVHEEEEEEEGENDSLQIEVPRRRSTPKQETVLFEPGKRVGFPFTK